jgi:4-hydroxybenzoate polyprenyltransferase
MVDREDDLAVGIKSTAILFGRFDVAVTGVLMVVMLVMLTVIGSSQGLGWPWFLAVFVTAILFTRQWLSVRGREREACFRAFLDNNRVGAVLFSGLLLHYVLSGAYGTV